MFKIGDIVEITAESSATGMLDFVDGKGYAVWDVGLKFNSVDLELIHIKLVDESGRRDWYAASHFKLKEEAKVEKKECLFKKGQVVWDLRNGRGIVVETADDERYPVIVKFDLKDADGHEIIDSYTEDGRFTITQNIRSLYFSEPKIEAATEPLFEPVLKEGDVVVMVDKNAHHKNYVIKVHKEDDEWVKNDCGTVFNKELFDFYKVGEKIEFN